MNTPASIGNHPIHPMLVVFPIGLWIFSFVSDLIFLLGKNLLWRKQIRYAVVGLGHIAQIAVLPAFKHAHHNSELAALISGSVQIGRASCRERV